MKLSEVKELLSAEVICNEEQLSSEVAHGFASNKIEDLINTKHDGVLLITGISTDETLRIANQANIKHILIIKEDISDSTKALSLDLGISLMRCQCSMFMAVAKLSDAGLLPVNP